MSRLVCDLETDGLYNDATKIHCIVTRDLDTWDINVYDNHRFSIEKGLAALQNADEIIGHNFIDFDTRVIKKLYGVKLDVDKITDTMLWSYMFDPHRGFHSLAKWGEKLGHAKPEHEDWTTYTPEMQSRCIEDVKITHKVYDELIQEYNSHDWELANRIEKRFRYIMSEQEAHGWPLDIPKAEALADRMDRACQKIEKLVRKEIPYVIQKGIPFTSVLKKDGTVKAAVENWYNTLDTRKFRIQDIVGDFTRVLYNNFKVGSSQQATKIMLKRGWEPLEYNYKKGKNGKVITENNVPVVTSPKLTYDSLRGDPVGEKIAKYSMFSHRRGQIRGWLDRMDNEEGNVRAGALTCACNTGRAAHRNVVNIPRVGTFLGSEMRSLFLCREGTKLVGMDFSALENRLMGHFCHMFDGGDYAKRLEDECPHENTVKLVDRFGLTISRNRAKTANYALGFGCGRGKLAQILSCDNWLAGKIHKVWWDDRESMKDLKEALTTSLRNRGHVKGRAGLWPGAWIKGLDGRKVYMRSMHAAVNTLIQSAGAVIDKFVTVSIQKGIDRQGLDAHFVGNFHDEVQCEVADKDIDKYKQIVIDSIEKVNSHFKLEVPMVGEIKTGTNWKQTH